MTKPSTIRYVYCGRWCEHCDVQGPFRRPEQSTDPWRCADCGRPERYYGGPDELVATVTCEPLTEPNIVVQLVAELEAARGEAAAGGNEYADIALAPTLPPSNGAQQNAPALNDAEAPACMHTRITRWCPKCPNTWQPAPEPVAPTARPDLCDALWLGPNRLVLPCKLPAGHVGAHVATGREWDDADSAARDACAQTKIGVVRAELTVTYAERDALQLQLQNVCRELDRERKGAEAEAATLRRERDEAYAECERLRAALAKANALLDSGAENPVVKGALDAQAEAERKWFAERKARELAVAHAAGMERTLFSLCDAIGVAEALKVRADDDSVTINASRWYRILGMACEALKGSSNGK